MSIARIMSISREEQAKSQKFVDALNELLDYIFTGHHTGLTQGAALTQDDFLIRLRLVPVWVLVMLVLVMSLPLVLFLVL